MFAWRMRATAVVVGLSLLVSACATRDVSTMTPAERRLHEQGEDFNRTLIEGAVVGAVAGAVLGALLSSKEHRGQGAAIGAGLGTAAGAAGGYYVAKQKERYANEEARLSAMTADVKVDNAKLMQMAATAREVMAEDRRRLEQVEQEIAAGKADQATTRQQLAGLDDNARYLQKTIGNLRKKVDEYKHAAEAERHEKRMNTMAMDSQIQQMESQVASLEAELNQLVSRRRLTRVG